MASRDAAPVRPRRRRPRPHHPSTLARHPTLRLLLLAALAAAASAASLQGVATQFGGPEDKQNQTEASGGLVDNACGYG